jgi:hypothetical protein
MGISYAILLNALSYTIGLYLTLLGGLTGNYPVFELPYPTEPPFIF